MLASEGGLSADRELHQLLILHPLECVGMTRICSARASDILTSILVELEPGCLRASVGKCIWNSVGSACMR